MVNYFMGGFVMGWRWKISNKLADAKRHLSFFDIFDIGKEGCEAQGIVGPRNRTVEFEFWKSEVHQSGVSCAFVAIGPPNQHGAASVLAEDITGFLKAFVGAIRVGPFAFDKRVGVVFAAFSLRAVLKIFFLKKGQEGVLFLWKDGPGKANIEFFHDRGPFRGCFVLKGEAKQKAADGTAASVSPKFGFGFHFLFSDRSQE